MSSTGNMRLAFVIEAVDRATKRLEAINAAVDRVTAPVRRVRAAFTGLMRESRMDRVRDGITGVSDSAQALMGWAQGAAGAIVGIGVAAGGALFGLKRVFDQVDAGADTAKKLGITYQELQRLSFAAQMNGSSGESVGDALMFISQNMVSAINGSQETVAWFNRVGLSVQQLRRMTAVQVFEAIADKFEEVGDTAGNAEKKIAVMRALMGRSGADLKQVLDQGSAGLRRFYEEADRIGAVIDGGTAEAIGDFNDEFDRMRSSLFGLAATAGRGAIPVLTDLIQRTTRWAAANRELVATRVGEFFERVLPQLPAFATSVVQIGSALGAMVAAADRVAQALGGWEVVLGFLAGAVVVKAVMAVYSLATALGALGAAMLVTPFGLVLGGIALLAAGAALVYRRWEPIKQFFVDLWGSVGRVLDVVRGWMGLPAAFATAPASERAGRAPLPAALAGRADRTEVGGRLVVELDAQGVPQVRSVQADGPMEISVYNGANGVLN